MKKMIKLDNLDCANCAAKMETAIGKLEGVQSASVSFFTQRLTLEVNDADALTGILEQASAVCKKIEPNCKLLY